MLSSCVVFVSFLLFCRCAVAQTNVVADGRLQTILEQHVAYNALCKTLSGYRINVAKFTGERAKDQAFALKKDLQDVYPEHKTYLIFDEPYFIVKIGDFRTRMEAYSLLTQIKPQIGSAVIMKDRVNAPVISLEDVKAPEYYEEDLEGDDREQD